jgi:hypothetical protein
VERRIPSNLNKAYCKTYENQWCAAPRCPRFWNSVTMVSRNAMVKILDGHFLPEGVTCDDVTVQKDPI